MGNKVVATGIYKQSGAFVVSILFFEIFQILISQDKAKNAFRLTDWSVLRPLALQIYVFLSDWQKYLFFFYVLTFF